MGDYVAYVYTLNVQDEGLVSDKRLMIIIKCITWKIHQSEAQLNPFESSKSNSQKTMEL
jgi:hypothetical protein